ncbi:MAG: hypothetical protein KF716_07870 [Anaerolineae bacterium]|nr:hypothetical protein [Anaerolineae bacterium]
MTAQIPDNFIYRGEEYALVGKEGDGLLTPLDYGMRPVMIHTACYRGFYCAYLVTEDGLYLTNMTVRTADDVYPVVDGYQPSVRDFTAIYRDMRILTNFTGKLRLARDFIEELYIHMGFQKPSAFRTVLDFQFSEGKLQNITDLSAYYAEMRGKFKEQYERDPNFPQRINDAFSLDLDVD